MRVLVVGGAGYIGSHVCRALAARGDEPIVFDNFCSGHRHAVKWGELVEGDIRNPADIARALSVHSPDAVMHFAANIEVGSGETQPLDFWDNNVGGVINLLKEMQAANCRTLVFSSTCATYGIPETVPMTEDEPQAPINVYGRTKLAVETMLSDLARCGHIDYAALRYFNACGASPDGDIGEEHDPETHLIPNALKAAAGLGGKMKLFGTDYPTRDGTCIRDYIHVVDLADVHLRALDHLIAGRGSFACNVGTGDGFTVREVLDAIARVTGRPVPFEEHPRRAGDPPVLSANTARAKSLLGFEPQHSSIDEIVADAWRFHQKVWAAELAELANQEQMEIA
ncbi:MAG: UDP-glucose 4-epimerase GalE [Maricaulis sp.]|uniref:UDP-glucose 4-epimerase GalE n=1 Tax=Maricaulis sp. TaxID=1486257 RepID=UPI001B142AA1|nr:UDP-glucose 4-epimerase GalE [Maricaulis sp.]MBO6728425.1 UDP-glucose 4-epimerase GalE [Maricaulis sp.]MBO6848416.1 UDP-glucose 4-epimerase GalE [Maricaulis sp.]MBO6878212.1 UDP-glucose 4-epimerase GalE [Maricaulis sp.]